MSNPNDVFILKVLSETLDAIAGKVFGHDGPYDGDELLLRIEALADGAAWLAMDTAPRDGTEVLLQVEMRAGVPGKCLVGHWQAGGHCIEDHPPIDAGWYFWNGCAFDVASKPVRWRTLR